LAVYIIVSMTYGYTNIKSDITVHDICFIPGFVTVRDEDRTIILITTNKPTSGMQLATPMLSPAHPPS